MNRRDFMMTAGVAAAAMHFIGSEPAHAGEFTGKIKKAVKYGMIKEGATP